jgi:hypothetical protein
MLHHLIHAALDVAGFFTVIGVLIGMTIAHFWGKARHRDRAARA